MFYHKNKTKLPVSDDLIKRPRIDALLEEGVKYPVCIVNAGAGYGKTQAVASFLEQFAYHTVWLELTTLDNQMARFWNNIVYICSLYHQELAEKLEELGFPDSLFKLHKFLEYLSDELKDHHVIFVFDDFHLITNEYVCVFFDCLIKAKIENVCFLFITRDSDSFMLQKDFYLLTAEDLRFREAEADAFFEEIMNTHDERAALYRYFTYTNGWPLALRLLRLMLQKPSAKPEECYQHSKRLIFDLFDRELFCNYNLKEQQFMVSLSLLNYFPQGLLFTIGQEMKLEVSKLLLNNTFISFDAKAGRYYFQQIFLDFLGEKRYLLNPEMVLEMQGLAGDWCTKNKRIIEAMDYYLHCRQFDKLWQIFLRMEGYRYSRNMADTYLYYMKHTPESYLDEHPMCRILYGMMLFNNLMSEDAQEQLNRAEQLLCENADTRANRLIWGELYTAKGLLAIEREEPNITQLFKQAAELLPRGSSRWGKNITIIGYGRPLYLVGIGKGDLQRCISSIQEGVPYVNKVLHGAAYGLELLAEGEAQLLIGQMESARMLAYRALYKAEEKQVFDIIDNALFLLLRIGLIKSDIKEIEDVIERLRQSKARQGIANSGMYDYVMGWYYVKVGRFNEIAGWIINSPEEQYSPIGVDQELLLKVRYMIGMQRFYEALAILERLERTYKQRNTYISMIYMELFRAIIYYQIDEKEEAVNSIKKTYDLTKENSLIIPFIQYGHKIRPILTYIKRKGESEIPREWVDKFIKKAATSYKRHAYLISRLGNQEEGENQKLTAREIELLKYLSQGLTRVEIAESMYVSPHTIKSMLKMVYNKLGAVNRADALRLAFNDDLI